MAQAVRESPGVKRVAGSRTRTKAQGRKHPRRRGVYQTVLASPPRSKRRAAQSDTAPRGSPDRKPTPPTEKASKTRAVMYHQSNTHAPTLEKTRRRKHEHTQGRKPTPSPNTGPFLRRRTEPRWGTITTSSDTSGAKRLVPRYCRIPDHNLVRRRRNNPRFRGSAPVAARAGAGRAYASNEAISPGTYEALRDGRTVHDRGKSR